jgi:hypothetical protein
MKLLQGVCHPEIRIPINNAKHCSRLTAQPFSRVSGIRTFLTPQGKFFLRFKENEEIPVHQSASRKISFLSAAMAVP